MNTDKQFVYQIIKFLINILKNIILITYQSLSYIITISAVARLIPKPPALVVNKNINFELFGLLNSSID